jgi:lipoprotein-releasing system permease protein
LKGVDANYSKVNAIESKLYNGQLQPNTYQVVVGYGIAQKFSLGLLDFNRQLEVLCQNRKGAIENPEEAFNKTDLIPVGIY